MKDNAADIKAGRLSIKTIVVRYIQKVAAAIGVKQTLKYLSLNFQQYANLKEKYAASLPFSIYAE
jgi:hypothetical protein